MLNYQKLMNATPTKYGEIVNVKGQLIEFYEHPKFGEEYPVIAVCHSLQLAAATNFYELDDMIAEHGEYTPIFIDGKIICGFELM